MKVLVFVPHNPVPCRSGAHYRMLEMLAGLRELGHEVALAACEDAAENPWSDSSTQWLIHNGLCQSVTVFREAGPSLIPRIAGRIWRRVSRGMRRRLAPGRTGSHFSDLTSAALRRWFKRLQAAQAPDCVLINYAWFSGLATPGRAQQGPRTLVDTHDMVSLNASMRYAIDRCLPAGVVFSPDAVPEEALDLGFYEARNLASEPAEFAALDRFDVTFAITLADAARIRESTRHTTVVALPTPVLSHANRREQGSLALFPSGPNPFNLQGYAWFMRKVLPRILEECADFTLGVSGTFNRPLTLEYHRSVRILGFVPDAIDLWAMGRMLVNPAFGGTGQPIKTLEAMAAGMPPVILDRFAYAAPVVHGVSGFIAADEAEFAACCVRLWKDPGLCIEMGNAAIEAVRRECSREKFADVLQRALGR